MKLLVGFAVLAVNFSVTTQASENALTTLNAKLWAENLKSAVAKNQAPEILRLTDFQALQNQVVNGSSDKIPLRMQKARDLFAQEKFQKALDIYNSIPKSSDYWIEAVEEKAWSYVRLAQTDKALAQTKTLMAPAFNSLVGPEPYFLQSLMQLRICDYTGVLTTLNLFKENLRSHIKEMQNLADGKTSLVLPQVLKRARVFPLTLKEVGPAVAQLPRLFYRDLEIQKAIMTIKMSEAASDAHIAANLTAKLDVAKAKATLNKRIKELAQAETNENFKMLQKLNLVEVETTQRVYADQNVDKKSYTPGAKVKAASDDLVFTDDGHPWIDEVDKYQMSLNTCPDNIRRKM